MAAVADIGDVAVAGVGAVAAALMDHKAGGVVRGQRVPVRASEAGQAVAAGRDGKAAGCGKVIVSHAVERVVTVGSGVIADNVVIGNVVIGIQSLQIAKRYPVQRHIADRAVGKEEPCAGVGVVQRISGAQHRHQGVTVCGSRRHVCHP